MVQSNLFPIPAEPASARLAAFLAAAALLANLALVAAFSGTGAYIAMALSLPVTLLAIYHWRWFGTQDNAFVILFGLAYAIFAAFIALPGRPAGSAIFIFDFIPFGFAIALYTALTRIRREALLQLLAYGSLLGTILAFGVAAYQVGVLGIGRAEGIGGSAIHFANISLLAGFLALAPLFSPGGWRWPFAMAPVFGVGAAILSGSRSMVLVGGAMVLVLLVHLALRYRSAANAARWRMAALLSLGAIVAVAAILAVWNGSQADRITGMFDQSLALMQGKAINDNSLALRFDFYASGIVAFFNAPWTGYGWHAAFGAAAPYMTVYDPFKDPAGTVRHLHNDVLNFAVSFGIPGVVAYLLALAAPVASWWRGARRSGFGSYGVFTLVAAYVAMGLTNSNFVYEPPKVMFCFAAAAVAALAARRDAA